MRLARLVALIVSLPLVAEGQAYRVVQGERAVYTLDYFNTTTSDFRALFGFDSIRNGSALFYRIDSKANAELVRTPIVMEGDNWATIYAFRNAAIDLTVNGQQDSATANAIAAELAQPIVVMMSKSGKILSASFQRRVGEVSRSFARSLLASVQFVLPDKSGSVWTTTESNPTGSYEAEYRLIGENQYRKRLTKYAPRAMRKGDVVVTQVITPAGEMKAVIDSHAGRLMSLGGVDSQTVTFRDKTIASGVTTLTLRYRKSESPAAAEVAAMKDAISGFDDKLFAEPLSKGASEEEDTKSISRAELGNETTASLIAKLGERDLRVGDTSSTTPLYLKIKALLYLHPESSIELGNLLKTARTNGPTMLIVSGAMGTVGHARAQSALLEAIKARPNDWAALATLIPTLGGVRSPLEASVLYLTHLSFDAEDRSVTGTAQLALGTMARNIAVDSPARAATIIAMLAGGLKKARTPQEKGDLLLALGNSASRDALSAIAGFLKNEVPIVRVAAVTALRWIDGDDVTAMLESARADANDNVRTAAEKALTDRARVR